MTRASLNLTITAIILMLAQAVVFNHMCLFGVAVPLVFIYVLIKLPVTLSLNWVMTIGFFLGLIDDAFADTYGMNALACTICATLRRPVLNLYLPRGEELGDLVPSLVSPGPGIFIKYLVTFTLIYCTFIFTIEAFTFFRFGTMILKIISSTALSSMLMIALDGLASRPRHEKGL